MLDHFRRILIAVVIFLLTGWLYKQWRERQDGYGLFELLDGGKGTSSATLSAGPRLRKEDVPALASLSEESAKLAAAVLPSVVSINTATPIIRETIFGRQLLGVSPGLGSGVIVSKEGHIVTNYHVVKGATQALVTTQDRKRHPIDLIGYDEDLDIAVLRIKDATEDLPALSFADSEKARVGEVVFAIGNPFGLTGTVTRGIISATQRRFSDSTHDVIQTDTVINPGNSGGPLVNIHGEVVGINVALFRGDANVDAWQGVGLAIPSNDVRTVFDLIMRGSDSRAGYLGIELEPATVDVTVPGTAKHFIGAVVSRVLPGSPAFQAGLQRGDVVILFDGRPFTNSSQLMQNVRMSHVGETKELEIIRGERRMTLKVTFVPRPKGA